MSSSWGNPAGFQTIQTLFFKNFIIPPFQRKFSWDITNINSFLSDIEECMTDPYDSKMSFGTLMLYKDSEFPLDTYGIFDGQQRMSTIFSLLLATRSVFGENHTKDDDINELIFKDFFEEKKSFSLSHPNKDVVDIWKFISDNPEKSISEIRNKAKEIFFDNSQISLEIDSYKKVKLPPTELGKILFAYEKCRDWISENIGDDRKNQSKFLRLFTSNLAFLVIETEGVYDAQRQFERYNNRGKTLTSFDLLKNQVLMSTSKLEHKKKVEEIWSSMEKISEITNIKSDSILRSYCISGTDLSKYEITTVAGSKKWIQEKSQVDKIKSNPIAFADELKNYWNFEKNMKSKQDPKDPWGFSCRPLKNALSINSKIDTIRPFLYAMSRIDKKFFHPIMMVIESAIAVSRFANLRPDDLGKTMISWIKIVINIKSEADYENFVIHQVGEFLSNNSSNALEFLSNPDQLTNRKSPSNEELSLILKKIAIYIDEQFEEVSLSRDMGFNRYNGYQIEHIMPQNESFDNEKIEWLGNLTILEGASNSSIKDNNFEAKKNAYEKSSCRMTRSLVKDQSVSKSANICGTVSSLPIYTFWDSSAIVKRQKNMAQLAIKSWYADDKFALLERGRLFLK
jgi:uncharacterized protein with ParB-like and HNH nuclease domain